MCLLGRQAMAIPGYATRHPVRHRGTFGPMVRVGRPRTGDGSYSHTTEWGGFMTGDIAVRPSRSVDVPPAGNFDALVIVPMYNEGSVIADTVADLRREFAHVVCVDDGSTDGSARLAAGAGATVVRHPTNLGQGAALQTGFAFGLRTRATYFVTFDADGQHLVSDAVRMLELARRGDVDVVLGSRFQQPAESVPPVRRWLLRAGVLFTRITTGLDLTDTHNGLRVLTVPAAQLMDLRLHGMAHASELLGTVARHGLRHVEVPMTVVYTDYSRAKGQSGVNAINILVDLLLARARYAP
jgi:hypothetical protein